MEAKARDDKDHKHGAFSRVQQWSWIWKFLKSKAVSSKVHRNKKTVILRVFNFLLHEGEILETQELFPRTRFTHKITY